MSPFAASPLARQRSINHHRQGREREFFPIPPLPSISKNSLIPSVRLIGTPSSFIFSSTVPSYIGTGTNESRLLPSSSSTNEEWWTTAGSLSTFSYSDPSGWLQYKWSQPTPRAPDWVFDNYKKINPLADVGCPFCNKEWLQQALCEDQQAASLLPLKLPGGPILLGARARTERAYKDWRWAVDELWEHKRHRLQTAARQCLLDKRATQECQEAACQEAACTAQRLLYKCATHKHQEAARQEAAHATQSLLGL
jgi:hypothetical protein